MTDIKREIVKEICNDYVEVILVGLDEHKEGFFYTTSIINFMESLKTKNIKISIDKVFTDTFIDKIYIETNKYIGGNHE